MRKVAKQVVRSQAETKFATAVVENSVAHNSAIGAGDLLPILPRIPQGTDDWQRVGDTIRPTKLTIRGTVGLDRNYLLDNKIILVRIVVLSSKATKNRVSTTSLFGTYSGELLHPNLDSGTQVKAFNGDLNDIHYPVNSDLFIVHYDKVHRISLIKDGSVEENPTGMFRWKKSIKLPAKLTYDVSQLDPNNFCPFYGIGYAYTDGTNPDTVATRIIANTDCTLFYKDS